jgi:hypothetical protein
MPLCVKMVRRVEPLILRCAGIVIGVRSRKRDVIAGTDDLKARRTHRPQDAIQRRIDRELRHGADSLRRHGGLGDEGFQHRAVVHCGKRIRPESPDVECDR